MMPELTAAEALLMSMPLLVAAVIAFLAVAVYRGRIRPPAAWTPGPDDLPPAGGAAVDEIWAAYHRTDRSADHA